MMITGKRPSQLRRTSSSSYVKVSTHGSPSHSSRSPSPTTSNPTTQPTRAATEQSESDEDLDQRNHLEKQFFGLVTKHDYKNVRNFLRDNREFDINAKDTEGLTVLHHAINNKDEEMVDILLKDNYEIEINDPMLKAIQDNSVSMVVQLLRGDAALKRKTKNVVNTLFTKKKRELVAEEYYDNDITPILMAAMHGHYELIGLFYNKGKRLGQLHFPRCHCPECGSASSDLKKSNNRIHLLKGLTNPTYLAFMAGVDKTFDPIFQAFKLINDLKKCIAEEPEFMREYEEILIEIQKFPVELLSQCRSDEETRIFLKREEGYVGISTPFSRLILAIDYEQKEFVAHPKAQDILNQEWNGELWDAIEIDVFTIVAAILFAPLSIILALTLCCLRHTRVMRLFTAPRVRFWQSLASYLCFLLPIYYMNGAEKGIAYQGPPSHFLPWIIVVFELSHFLTFLKHFFISRKHFMTHLWNYFELFNHIFFIVTFVLWIILWHRQRRFGMVFLRSKKGTTHTVERGYLDELDILLMSEITTALASTMAGLRLLRIVILHPTLGPIQIALEKMGKDVLLFVVLFAVIISSFALGFQHLMRPYSKLKETCNLCDLPSALEALFLGVFGLGSANNPELPRMPIQGTNVTNHHFFTESVGKTTFIAFQVLCVAFLMNMMTGMMSSQYGNIITNVIVEWKYGRSKIWVYYIQDDSLTAPFNLLPNCVHWCNFLAWVRAVMSKETRKQAACNTAQCCFVEEAVNDRKERDRKYPRLMRRLLQRYFRSKSSTASRDPPVSENIIDVHKQVIALRKLATLGQEPAQPSPDAKVDEQRTQPQTVKTVPSPLSSSVSQTKSEPPSTIVLQPQLPPPPSKGQRASISASTPSAGLTPASKK